MKKKIVLLTFVITLLSSAVIVTSATQSTILRARKGFRRKTMGNVTFACNIGVHACMKKKKGEVSVSSMLVAIYPVSG
jgi:hypothetical protein